MKKLCIIILCLTTLTSFAADKKKPAEPVYSYGGKKISGQTFKKLFNLFKNKLFVIDGGQIANLIEPDGKTKKISMFKKETGGGEITGKVVKVINKHTFILNAKEIELITKYSRTRNDRKTGKKGTPYTYNIYHHYTVAISGLDTSEVFQNDNFTAKVMSSGVYIEQRKSRAYTADNSRRYRQFDVARPISEPEFKKYLDKGNKLYVYRNKFAGYTPCEKCRGEGDIPNPKYKRGRLSPKTIDCPDCISGKLKKYQYVKTEVKAKRKRFASNY